MTAVKCLSGQSGLLVIDEVDDEVTVICQPDVELARCLCLRPSVSVCCRGSVG